MLPTDRSFRYLLVPAVVFIAACADRNYQTDLWHHLARGRAIVAQGQLLDHDVFTYTFPGKPLQDVNWIWQVLFFRLHAWGGLPLVQTANAAALALAFFLLVRLAHRRSDSLPAACAMGLFAFLGLWQLLIVRPQTFSFLLFVLLYAILEGARQRRWLLALPPFLLAAWANLHGGFPIGLVLVAAFALGEAVEKWREGTPGLVRGLAPWAACGLACAAATLANPYGWRVYEYVALTSGIAPARKIDEWLPPGSAMLIGKVWILSLLLALALLTLSPRRPSAREIVLLGAFLPFACGSVRMVAWWLLVSAPVLAAQLAAWFPRLRDNPEVAERPSRGAALACGVLAFFALLSLPWCDGFNPAMALPGRSHRTEYDLEAAARHLRQEAPTGRVFTRFAWGEYFGWSLNPRYTVFMDGRIEIIPNRVWEEYGSVTRGRTNWEEILDAYKVDVLVLDAGAYHHDLLPLVKQSPHWQETFHQGNVVVFARRQ
jgi:hypothetical protein